MKNQKLKMCGTILTVLAVLSLALAATGGEKGDNRSSNQAGFVYSFAPADTVNLSMPIVEDSEGITDWVMPDTKTTTSVITLINNNNYTVKFNIVVLKTQGDPIGITVEMQGFATGRLATDPVSSNEGHWSNIGVMNIGSNALTAFAALPKGVKIDGYVAWGSSENEYDPAISAPVLPIRFMTDKVEIK